MGTTPRLHPVLALLAGLALVAAACGDSGSTSSSDSATITTEPAATSATAATEPETTGSDDVDLTQGPSECPTEGDEFEEAKLYIEHNATDEDTGVHGLFGGEAWSVLCITDPNGTEMLLADPLNAFDALAVSDLFFESREPPNTDFPIAELQEAFPAGAYQVAAIDYEGNPRVGAATFTHDIPSEPEITTPPLADDAETAGDSTVPTTGLVVEWEPVTESITGEPVTIIGYEVIVTQEEWDDANALSRPVYDVHVPGGQTSLSVADDFLRPATIYEIEVLALEESGNQTIGLGFVITE